MSELDKHSLDEDISIPLEQKIKIAIAVILSIVLGFLAFFALRKVDTTTPPAVSETLPEDVELEFDALHVAKSSWRDGAWCAVDKNAVTSIQIVPTYDGSSQSAWTIDEMIFYFLEDGTVYIAVGPGVHMVGSMHRAFADFVNATQIKTSAI